MIQNKPILHQRKTEYFFFSPVRKWKKGEMAKEFKLDTHKPNIL